MHGPAARPSLHSGQDGCRVEYINVRPEGPLALVLPLPHWSLPPTLGRHLLLLTNPHVLPPPHHSITPKGKLWQEEARLDPSHPLPGILGVGRGRSREKTSSELKFGDCQCQEKLNNPVTSMKVNSRSAAHGKYECRETGERAASARHGGQPPLQGPGQGGGRGTCPLPSLPGSSPPGAPNKYGAAQLLDNLQAGHQGPRETLVCTSSICSRTPAQALASHPPRSTLVTNHYSH